MIKTADISECGKYRYSLTRVWDAKSPLMGFVMLNPSTADAHIDDPTIRRCISFAKREGFGGIHVVNVFSWRSSSPKKLKAALSARFDVVGTKNFEALKECARKCPLVVAAWGGNVTDLSRKHISAQVQMITVLDVLENSDCDSRCLGVTAKGEPKHPLYLKSDVPLGPYPTEE